MDCTCAPTFRFFSVASNGATTERRFRTAFFSSFFTSFRKDSVANYASPWTLFSHFFETRCAFLVTKHIAVRRQMAPRESVMCGGNITKRKNSAAQLCEILRKLTIYIVINSTVVQQHTRVIISCRYALSFVGRCFCFQFYYAALLPRRGPHIASHSVCPSVCPSVPLSLPSVTSYRPRQRFAADFFSERDCTFRRATYFSHSQPGGATILAKLWPKLCERKVQKSAASHSHNAVLGVLTFMGRVFLRGQPRRFGSDS